MSISCRVSTPTSLTISVHPEIGKLIIYGWGLPLMRKDLIKSPVLLHCILIKVIAIYNG